MAMTKAEAIKIFGTTQIEMAKALGKTKQAINQWGEILTSDQERLVLGAALQHGKKIPHIDKVSV